jgi:hypothetical protein
LRARAERREWDGGLRANTKYHSLTATFNLHRCPKLLGSSRNAPPNVAPQPGGRQDPSVGAHGGSFRGLDFATAPKPLLIAADAAAQFWWEECNALKAWWVAGVLSHEGRVCGWGCFGPVLEARWILS